MQHTFRVTTQLKMALVRLFGTKYQTVEEGFVVTWYRYRDGVYLDTMRKI